MTAHPDGTFPRDGIPTGIPIAQCHGSYGMDEQHHRDMDGTVVPTYDGLSFGRHMIAGAIAGTVEHVSMFPIDTIKTRMQQSTGRTGMRIGQNVIKGFQHIIAKEGFRGIYRGWGAMAMGAGPAHAVYFATYEESKELFGGNRPGHHPIAHGSSGACATLVSDAVFTPMDVVKQRLQMRHSQYKGIGDCMRRMLAEEGPSALFRSYPTTVVMNVPFTMVHFATYESAKVLMGGGHGSAEEETFLLQLVAGGAAGGAAGALTNPLDVVKTRLQTTRVGEVADYSPSVFKTLQHIVRTEGYSALLRGISARVVFHVPAAAVCWTVYEACKGGLAGG